MSGGNARNALLLKVNLVLIERVVHATRTVIGEYRVEPTPFREGQLVSAIYEEMVTDGAIELSYEEVLRRVEETFRVSKWRAEAKAAEQWPGESPGWVHEDLETEENTRQGKIWQWLEAHRRGMAWALAGAALLVGALISQMIINRWF